MQIRNFSLPVAIVTLSLLIDSTDAVPVKRLIKRDAEPAEQVESVKRNVIIKRGYYVGGRKGTPDPPKVKRDRFAAYGYPISVDRRDSNGSSAGSIPSKIDDDDVRTATSVQASNSSSNTSKSSANATDSTPPKPSTTSSGSNNGTTITLPKGVTAATSGFLFIPVSQAASPSAASNSSKSNSTSTQSTASSITRQTFYINIEAGLGGAAQTVQLDAVNGKLAATPKANGSNSGAKTSDDSKSVSNKSSGDQGNNSKGNDAHPKPKSNDKQTGVGGNVGDDDSGNKHDKDDKAQKSSKDNKQSFSDDDDNKGDDDDGKGSNTGGSSSSSKSDKPTDASNTSTDVRKIIFKPLKDPDQDSGNQTMSLPTLDVKGADKAETQDLKDVSSSDDKKVADSDKSSDKSSSKSDDSSSSDSSSSASNSTSSSSKQSNDNYFLFPVEKDKQQVDLAKGDMIAYVEHPQSAAKNVGQKQSRDVSTPNDDNVGYHRRSYGSMFEPAVPQKRSGDFARRAKEFFKRNLVNGKPGVKPEYWTGQKYEKNSHSSRGHPASSVKVKANDDEGDFLKRSGLDQSEPDNDRPVFFLVKRDPEESLRYAEGFSRR